MRRLRASLPDDLEAVGVSALRVQSEEQMTLLLDGALADASVVVVRLHGELDSLPGFPLLQTWAAEQGVPVVVLSGTGEPRADFARVSTVGLDVVESARVYLTMGGERNIAECIKFLADRLLLTGYGSAPPLDTPEHGVYLRDVENATLDDWDQRHDRARPTAAILFYRAHALSGNVAFIDELVEALEQRGLNALPVFTSSLRARVDGMPAALALIDGRANVLISTLSFALADGDSESVFERLGIPVVQAITSGMPREAWEVSQRGLTSLDTAINVALPEFDGRIIGVPISFKDRAEDAPGLYAPHVERTARVAGLAAKLARLQTGPAATCASPSS